MNIEELADSTLWILVSDIARILNLHHKEDNEVTMYWYLLYTDIQKELDRRMIADKEIK